MRDVRGGEHVHEFIEEWMKGPEPPKTEQDYEATWGMNNAQGLKALEQMKDMMRG